MANIQGLNTSKMMLSKSGNFVRQKLHKLYFMRVIEFIQQPWHWLLSGTLIAIVMIILTLWGKVFGVSRNFKTLCSAVGLGKNSEYFQINWKEQKWNLVFIIGSIIGGLITKQYLTNGEPINISENTIADIAALGFAKPNGFQPDELFSIEAMLSVKGFFVLAIGGFLIGFGTRYANGCTSGHAITGLSHLQITSLVAVIGFFIGGLLMTHLIFPLIF